MLEKTDKMMKVGWEKGPAINLTLLSNLILLINKRLISLILRMAHIV